MIDRETIFKFAKQAGMNFSPAQFSGVLECETHEFQIEEFAALVALLAAEACAALAQTEWSNEAEKVYGEKLAEMIRASCTTKEQA